MNYWVVVHGGIRHLEKSEVVARMKIRVHGGIRHLEIKVSY